MITYPYRPIKPSMIILLLFIKGILLGQTSNSEEAIQIHIDDKVGKVVYHQVRKSETLYAVSQKYSTSMHDILALNPQVDALDLTEKDNLVIPIQDSNVILHKSAITKHSAYVPLHYRVRAKDNVFRIARIYFDMPAKLLLQRNDLERNDLHIGQMLHIGWIKKTIKPLLVFEGTPFITDRVDDYVELFNRQKVSTTAGNEVAFWKKDQKSTGHFVMHRMAEVGSIIEITNPLLGYQLYAKVVGTIPANLYAQEIDLVISAELANQLGAIDQKFFVRTRYPTNQASASR